MTAITVFGKPGCMPCRSTKKFLENNSIPHIYVDVTVDDSAMDTIKSLEYSSVPVVVTVDDHWAGYQPEKLQGLLQSQAS